MTNHVGMTPQGFSIKRLPEIKDDIDAALRIALGADASLFPDSIEGNLSSIFSIIISEQWEQLSAAYNAFNPLYASGQALDNIALLTGISRLSPLPSRAMLSITGIDGTIVPSGSIIKNSSSLVEFLTEKPIEIGEGFPSGTAKVFASTRNNGGIESLSGSLTLIDTPVNGWDTVVNSSDATKGRSSENDSELRARRERSLSISGQGSLSAIISSIQVVPNVAFAVAIENSTNSISIGGLPPHSFECVVSGGNPDDISQAIWNKKPAGILAFGDITANAIDIFGGTHEVLFSRPVQVAIYLNANVTFLGEVEGGASEVLSQSIIDFVNGNLIPGQSIEIGDTIINSRMYIPLNLSYNNISINSLTMSTDGINFDSLDIQILFNEIGVFDISRINILVG